MLTYELFEKHYPQIVCTTSTREYGNQSNSLKLPYIGTAERRQKVYRAVGLPEGNYYVRANMLHGALTYEVGMQLPNPAPSVDIMLTKIADRYLAIDTGDCLAIMGFDPYSQIVFNQHVGRRGVHIEAIKEFIAYLKREHSIDPATLLIVMSPAQQAASSLYEFLGPELSGPKWKPYVKRIRLHGKRLYQVRWADRAYDQLLASGVQALRIERSLIDTYTDERFFSHARFTNLGDQLNGRHANLIGMRYVLKSEIALHAEMVKLRNEITGGNVSAVMTLLTRSRYAETTNFPTLSQLSEEKQLEIQTKRLMTVGILPTDLESERRAYIKGMYELHHKAWEVSPNPV